MERRSAPAPGSNREEFETMFLHDNRVVVLNSDLNPIATHLLAEKWTATPGIKVEVLANGSAKPSLAVLTDKVQILSLTKIRRPLFVSSESVRDKR